MKKKLTQISIGIPAFNEANGIALIIQDILKQKEEPNWKLKEILVYCDGCEDDTAKIARNFKDHRIKVIDSKERLGKTKRLQQMFLAFSGDIIITVDADLRIPNKRVLSEIVKQFSDQDIQLVAGNVQADLPKTFVQRAVYSTFSVYDEVRKKQNNGNNLYCCAACLALTKEFAHSINFPNIVNEDIYIYLWCIQRGGKFSWCQKAIMYYKLPLNFKDYIKQIMRSEPTALSVELGPLFPGIIEPELHRDKVIYAKEVFTVFCKHPLEVITVVIINLCCKPFISHVISHYNLNWFTAESTH